jgi:hypothetical protein
MVSAVGDLHAQVFLDLLQVLVVAAAEHREPAVIGGQETEFDGLASCAQFGM